MFTPSRAARPLLLLHESEVKSRLLVTSIYSHRSVEHVNLQGKQTDTEGRGRLKPP